jgi:hypothetical protein
VFLGEDEQEIDLHRPVRAPERYGESTSESEGSDTVLPPVRCFGLTATAAASGLTHTVPWAATRLHDSSCVNNAVSHTEFFYVHEICNVFPTLCSDIPITTVCFFSTIIVRRR